MTGRVVQGFGELETAIMQRLWSLGHPATGRMVYESLRDQRASAYTTVMTVMGILLEKGWLRRERGGRAWVYEPTLTREQYLAQVMLQALRDTEDRETLFACIAEGLSLHDSRALQAALRRTNTARRKASRSAP